MATRRAATKKIPRSGRAGEVWCRLRFRVTRPRLTTIFYLTEAAAPSARRFSVRGPGLKIRGVLLFLAVFCSVLASPAVAATSGRVVPGTQQAAPRVTANPFGIPFPASRDPQQWRAWQEHVRAQFEARRNTHVRANASGASGSGIIETIAGAIEGQSVRVLQLSRRGDGVNNPGRGVHFANRSFAVI